MITNAQTAWGDEIVAIGASKDNRSECQKLAEKLVKELYAYEHGTVLFKPTKARDDQFRLNIPAALSYFIGGDPDYPEDNGFALNPWQAVTFDNIGFILQPQYALAMGNYHFTDDASNITKVEYTFGYTLHEERLLINLQHSSLPYTR